MCFFDARRPKIGMIIPKQKKGGMKLHSANRWKQMLAGSLLAALLPMSPALSAEEQAKPVQLIVPSDPAALPPPVIGKSIPPRNGPLRMTIPNLVEKQPPDAKVAKTPDAPPADTAASIAPQEKTEPTVMQALYAGAQEVWNNGVTLADMGQKFVKRSMFRPNLPFDQLPETWEMAKADSSVILPGADAPAAPSVEVASAETLANLAPAAGEPTEPLVTPSEGDNAVETSATPPTAEEPAAGAITPNAPQVDLPPDLVPENAKKKKPVITPAANAAIAAANKAAAAAANTDPTEPAPTLSNASRDIAAKIPQVEDAKVKETPRKVAIQRQKAAQPDVLSKGAEEAAPQSLALRVDQPHARMDVNYELGRAYDALMAGNSDIAIQVYEDILTNEPANQEALFGLASTYHRAGQIDTARALYGKLLEIDPKHRDGLNNFLVLLSDEAPQEALQQMERLEGQNPGFSPIPAQMAIIYQKLGNTDKAVDKMYRAVAISPENTTYRYNLAIMLDRSGNYDKAATLYSQILKAAERGEVIPGDARKIQQRLTFIRSNIRK